MYNWNKIRNLDVGDFCKNPETGQLLFSLPTFWRIWFLYINGVDKIDEDVI
jgi:hypothetical protein